VIFDHILLFQGLKPANVLYANAALKPGLFMITALFAKQGQSSRSSGTPLENPAFPALALARERSLRAVCRAIFIRPWRGWIFMITARFAKKAVNQIPYICYFRFDIMSFLIEDKDMLNSASLPAFFTLCSKTHE
jgi:hypothetical protein